MLLPDGGAPGGRDGVVLREGESEADDEAPGQHVPAADGVGGDEEGQALQESHLSPGAL